MRMSSPFGGRGTYRGSARRGGGGSDHTRGSFGSTRGSCGNAIVDLSSKINDPFSAVIQNPTEIVDLIVGPKEALFLVHKSFLRNKIQYFDKMFNGGFKEAKENSAKFPEDLPESFDILIEWVYSGHVRFYEVGDNAGPENWNFLCFYALAEKLGLTQLEDRALDIYRHSCRAKNSNFGMDWATNAYQITPEGAALRRYTIQVLVWRFHTQENLGSNLNDHFIKAMQSDNDLFADYMLTLRKHVKVGAPTDPRVIDPKIPATKCDNVGIETVDLYIGPTRTHYRVHKNILCTKIPYFNKMFNGGFSEASNNSAEFPEDSPQSFDYHPLRPLNRVSPGSVSSNWNTIDFYLLMDKLCIPDLMNEAMDLLRQFSKDNDFLPSINHVIWVYRRSLPGSKIRLYVLNSLLYAFSLNQEPDLTPMTLLMGIVTRETDLAADFLTAVRGQIRGGPKPTNPSAGDGGIYHIHGEGIGCSCSLN
ncbi:uncharacterized protein EAF02_003565 [Botrytis sinoallii]|uniref:uncharacterized protein n=1 Tax=Botrytis sinoallii TaxID=1463999 RepID=UPI001900A013|nr:uncharacterized protein EAF02_003565 [Botrytis sinoallii]KAF7886918.1 hypothetical protein EAF02_003565 [Botrytis sinoallii]